MSGLWAQPGVSKVADRVLGLRNAELCRRFRRLIARRERMAVVGRPEPVPAGDRDAWAYAHVPRTIRQDAGRCIPVSPNSAQEAWLPAFVERIEERVEKLAPGFRNNL